MEGRLKSAAKGMCIAGGTALVALGGIWVVELIAMHYGDTGLLAATIVFVLLLGAVMGIVYDGGGA